MTSQNEDYQPCSKRTSLISFQRDGSKTKIQRCGEPSAEYNGKNVTPEICEACPVRAEVTRKAIVAQSFTPPLATDAYEIQSMKRDTDPKPPWKPCRDRNTATVAACCGGVTEIRVCDSIDCFRIGSQVSADICSSCPFRNP